MLLSSQTVTLQQNGIPLKSVHQLERSRRFYDENLRSGYGSDAEVDEINRMESSLGDLSPAQVDRRIAADFCCIWRYDYPARVHELCAIIGDSYQCGLRLHYQISPGRRQELIDYADALQGWLADKPLEHYDQEAVNTAQRVYGFLGGRDPLKKMLVERTYYGLSHRAVNCSFWGYNEDGQSVALAPATVKDTEAGWQERMSSLERSIRREMGSAANRFLCDVGGSAEPACHFKFVRRIDVLVSSIGCLQWRGNLPPKGRDITGRRSITKQYLDILEGYWTGSGKSCTEPEGAAVENDLLAVLGPPDDCKRWLVASLWKNIKNQTTFHAYPMRHWVDFVRIGEDYIASMTA